MDMLTKFFKNNQNSVDSTNRNIGEKFYLKPHAEKDFFAWVNQWAMMVKMPSDLGFSNDRYVLPELIINHNVVKNQSLTDINGQINIFTPIAKSMTEVRHEQKQTEQKRCEKAIELASGKTSVYWCNTNIESAFLKSMDKEAAEIINDIAIMLKDNQRQIQVEGHTDNIEIHTPLFFSNWELSAVRATAVVRLFTDTGISAKRLSAIGFSSAQPVSDNETPLGRAKNRRVSIMILYESQIPEESSLDITPSKSL
jgi:flagellar motor protein MotB